MTKCREPKWCWANLNCEYFLFLFFHYKIKVYNSGQSYNRLILLSFMTPSCFAFERLTLYIHPTHSLIADFPQLHLASRSASFQARHRSQISTFKPNLQLLQHLYPNLAHLIFMTEFNPSWFPQVLPRIVPVPPSFFHLSSAYPDHSSSFTTLLT